MVVGYWIPMTKDECKKAVLDIIADIAPDEDLSNVKPEVRLRDQLQLDSMDFLDIVMELRKRHGIEVPEADYGHLASLGQLRRLPHSQVQRAFGLEGPGVLNSRSHYDVAIIGAGLSGLAAGVRLAHFGKRVCIFERHNVPGGLNSFYSLGGRKYDVGLHALTNYVRPGVKGTPLGKLLRQLRIDREEFALCEQKGSRIAFGPRGETSLRCTNDFSVLESEVAREFPAQVDGFRRLARLVARDPVFLPDAAPVSAREVIRRHIDDPLLEDMLLCPLMFYGSAREHDMDFGQFAVMFEAIWLEGMARPFEGVRVIMRVLLEKYREAGGERRMKCGVRRIVASGDRAAALILDSGEEVTADEVLSSIGAPETEALIDNSSTGFPARVLGSPGQVAFVETISILNRQPAELGLGSDTIVFFNDSPRFTYARPGGPSGSPQRGHLHSQ